MKHDAVQIISGADVEVQSRVELHVARGGRAVGRRKIGLRQRDDGVWKGIPTDANITEPRVSLGLAKRVEGIRPVGNRNDLDIRDRFPGCQGDAICRSHIPLVPNLALKLAFRLLVPWSQ